VATRLTRATGDCERRRERPLLLFRPLLLRPPLLLFRPLLLRPPALRPEARLLDPRDDLRAPPLRRDEEDFLLLRPRADLRAPPELLPPERFLAPPRLRPEDPARFLPPFDRLDFLAAAMGMLHARGFVEPIARFAHNTTRPCATNRSKHDDAARIKRVGAFLHGALSRAATSRARWRARRCAFGWGARPSARR
jgi:hypothetical protein